MFPPKPASSKCLRNWRSPGKGLQFSAVAIANTSRECAPSPWSVTPELTFWQHCTSIFLLLNKSSILFKKRDFLMREFHKTPSKENEISVFSVGWLNSSPFLWASVNNLLTNIYFTVAFCHRKFTDFCGFEFEFEFVKILARFPGFHLFVCFWCYFVLVQNCSEGKFMASVCTHTIGCIKFLTLAQGGFQWMMATILSERWPLQCILSGAEATFNDWC